MRQALRGLEPAGDARAVRGPGLPLPERPEDLTGGQGTALAGSRGRSRCRTPALARLSREAGRKREGIPGPTGLGVPDARAWAASNKQGQGRDRAGPRVPRHRQPHGPSDARVLGPEVHAAGRGGGDVISAHTNSRSLVF